MASIEWIPAALEDLVGLHDLIRTHSPAAAVRAMGVFLCEVNRLQDAPQLGKPWEDDLDFRELPVRFGARDYIVRYRVYDNRVIVTRIKSDLA